MTYVAREPISITSLVGVNSDSVISGGNWSVDTYTGVGEVNNYAYVGVNLQVDEAGTLYFDFSQDGTNWSTFPVAGFTVVSNINEVHTAWKGGRYFRVRFVGVGGRTYFRLKTFFTNAALPLSAPLNQSIGSDQDAQVVRAVLTGQKPDTTYINIPADGSGFRTTTDLAAGATYDSGVLSIENYTQVQTDIVCNENGTLKFIFGSESTMTGETVGTNGVERVVSIPYLAANGFQVYSAPAFTPYVRYKFTNDGASLTTQLFFDTKFITKALSGQLLGINASLAPSMVANLGRNVLVGQEGDGDFENVSVTETMNDAGIYHNLNVVSGARPSQLAGRTNVRIVIDGVTVNTLLRTNTGVKNVYITDLLLTVDNSSTTASGVIKLRDGVTVAGAVVLPLLVAEAPTSETAVTVISNSFNEPLLFTDGVFLEEGAGVNTVSGVLVGYEE
jgi:hypothetical protein